MDVRSCFSGASASHASLMGPLPWARTHAAAVPVHSTHRPAAALVLVLVPTPSCAAPSRLTVPEACRYRNQIFCIQGRSPAEGAFSEGFITAKFTQVRQAQQALAGGSEACQSWFNCSVES